MAVAFESGVTAELRSELEAVGVVVLDRAK